MSPDLFTAGLPTGAVEIDPEVLPFWDGAERGVLVLPYCGNCSRYFWYPRGFCPRCSSTDLSWRTSDGLGEIYSFAVVHQAFGEWREHAPFVIAYVRLTEGITVSTNIVDCRIDQLEVGRRVQAIFERSSPDHQPALRFCPIP